MKNITDLIAEHEGLIYKIISKYQNYFEIEDLYQVAVMGLIEAYHNYKAEYNTKFISYAYPYILGEVIKYVNTYRAIKLNKKTQILYLKILKAREILTQKLMKEPTTYEMSLYLEIDEPVIEEVLLATSTVESLDKIVSEDDKIFTLYDKLGYYDERIENYSLKEELQNLPQEERQIIIGRFYDNLSQREIGKKLGMYQMEVSRKESKILKKLHDNIAA